MTDVGERGSEQVGDLVHLVSTGLPHVIIPRRDGRHVSLHGLRIVRRVDLHQLLTSAHQVVHQRSTVLDDLQRRLNTPSHPPNTVPPPKQRLDQFSRFCSRR